MHPRLVQMWLQRLFITVCSLVSGETCSVVKVNRKDRVAHQLPAFQLLGKQLWPVNIKPNGALSSQSVSCSGRELQSLPNSQCRELETFTNQSNLKYN